MNILLHLTTGAAFGVALSASGVALPSVILDQMRLQNFHMLQSFLAASACSALLVSVAAWANWAPISIRKPSSYGWIMTYEGNVLGGLMIGVGMTLTGACPGTVLVQVANGVRSGYFAALGCVLGGYLFVVLSPLRRSTVSPDRVGSHTIQTKLSITTRNVLLGYEAMCAAMLAISSLATGPTQSWLSSVVGGLAIGLAQALSLLLTRKTVGVSTGWEDLGRWLYSRIRVPSGASPKLWTPSIIFASGVVLGSMAVAPFLPWTLAASSRVHPLGAFVGGVSMVFGARLAGGCTSGHGISGMATFSVASFVTVAAMFGGGIATAMIY